MDATCEYLTRIRELEEYAVIEGGKQTARIAELEGEVERLRGLGREIIEVIRSQARWWDKDEATKVQGYAAAYLLMRIEPLIDSAAPPATDVTNPEAPEDGERVTDKPDLEV